MARSHQIYLALALGLVAAAARAQFSQYSPPESFGGPAKPMGTRLDDAITEARWKIGRVYLDPDFGIRNVAWVEDLGLGQEGGTSRSGLTGAAGLGLRAYVPVGESLTWAAHLAGEYIWWENSPERRRLGGRYGVGFFGDLGAVGVEASASGNREVRFVSREIEQRANQSSEVANLGLELPIKGAFLLYAGGSFRRIRYLDEPTLDGLNRDELSVRAGVRYGFRRGVTVGLGYTRTEADFDQRRGLSNDGDGPVFDLSYDTGQVFFTASAAYLSLDSRDALGAVGFEDTTGTLRISYRASGPLALELFGNRNVVWAIGEEADFFDDSAWGVGVRASLGTSASLRLFGEVGDNEYATFAAGPTGRIDEVTAWGADLRVALGRFGLRLGVTRTDYDSNLMQFDRTVTRYRTGIGLKVVEDLSPWG